MGNCLPNYCGSDPMNQGMYVGAPPRLPMLIQVEVRNLEKKSPFFRSSREFNPSLQVTSAEHIYHTIYKSLIKQKYNKDYAQWLFKIELSDYERKEMKFNFYVHYNSAWKTSRNFIIGQALDMKLVIGYNQNLLQDTSSGSTRITGLIKIKDMGYFVKPPLNMPTIGPTNTPTTGLARPIAFVVKFEAKIQYTLMDFIASRHPVMRISAPWNSYGEWNKEKHNGKWQNVRKELVTAEANYLRIKGPRCTFGWDMLKIKLPMDYDDSFQSEFRREKLLLEVGDQKHHKILLGSVEVSIEGLLFRKRDIGLVYESELWKDIDGTNISVGTLYLQDFGLFVKEEAAENKKG